MPLLIDGHNLIGRLPDISLDDPNDEAKLVVRLRRWCARTGRQATVVFDAGLPGGPSRELSSGSVKVVFAPTGGSADATLRSRIRHAWDPRGLVVVSSDREITAAAETRGARVVRAEEFAAQLGAVPSRGDEEEVVLSPQEIQRWLDLFERME